MKLYFKIYKSFGYIVYVKIFIDCIKLILDMQDEKDYLNHCNEFFLHILDFEKLF